MKTLGLTFEPLSTDFAASPDSVRLLLLVSPTWTYCVDGALRAGDELLRAIPNAGLRVHYVWLPVLPSDDRGAAIANEARMASERAQHYWDEGLRFAHHMASALGIGDTLAPDGTPAKGVAWDVYLLYPRGAAVIERPAFWMHQLDTTLAPRLDAVALADRVRALLR